MTNKKGNIQQNKLSLKDLQQQIDEMKGMKANQSSELPPIVVDKASNAKIGFLKKVVPYFAFVALTTYAHKLPLIGKLVVYITSIFEKVYGRTLLWKLLVWSRKTFIVGNAIIGLVALFMIVGPSADTFSALITGMGTTYFEMFTGFWKLVYHWFRNFFNWSYPDFNNIKGWFSTYGNTVPGNETPSINVNVNPAHTPSKIPPVELPAPTDPFESLRKLYKVASPDISNWSWWNIAYIAGGVVVTAGVFYLISCIPSFINSVIGGSRPDPRPPQPDPGAGSSSQGAIGQAAAAGATPLVASAFKNFFLNKVTGGLYSTWDSVTGFFTNNGWEGLPLAKRLAYEAFMERQSSPKSCNRTLFPWSPNGDPTLNAPTRYRIMFFGETLAEKTDRETILENTLSKHQLYWKEIELKDNRTKNASGSLAGSLGGSGANTPNKSKPFVTDLTDVTKRLTESLKSSVDNWLTPEPSGSVGDAYQNNHIPKPVEALFPTRWRMRIENMNQINSIFNAYKIAGLESPDLLKLKLKVDKAGSMISFIRELEADLTNAREAAADLKTAELNKSIAASLKKGGALFPPSSPVPTTASDGSLSQTVVTPEIKVTRSTPPLSSIDSVYPQTGESYSGDRRYYILDFYKANGVNVNIRWYTPELLDKVLELNKLLENKRFGQGEPHILEMKLAFENNKNIDEMIEWITNTYPDRLDTYHFLNELKGHGLYFSDSWYDPSNTENVLKLNSYLTQINSGGGSVTFDEVKTALKAFPQITDFTNWLEHKTSLILNSQAAATSKT